MGQEYHRSIFLSNEPVPHGNILLIDNMQDVFKWLKDGTGADYAVTRAQNSVFSKDYSLDLITRATDPAAEDYVYGYRFFPPRFQRSYKIEAAISFSSYDDTKYVDITAQYDTKDAYLQSALRLDVQDDELQIRISGPAYQTISTGEHLLTYGTWHYISLSVDFVTQKYISATFNNQEFDLSAYSIHAAATRNYELGEVGFYLEAETDQRPSLYVDDVLCSRLQ